MDKIQSIISTRKLAAEILIKSLTEANGLSEFEIAEKIKNEFKSNNEIFPEGWYSPPPSGVAILFCQLPFERLKYESLRNQEFWPQKNIFLENETVGLIYCSPVNRQSKMLADIGFTLYKGDNKRIGQHLKNVYQDTFAVAQQAEVGMSFTELSKFALNLFKGKYKLTRWVTTSSSNDFQINLGHTIPGSYENIDFGNDFEKIKETIRTKRQSVTDIDPFIITETCAFTIESRLEDISDPTLPSGYFHFIVCFEKGRKTILENYKEIFNLVGMSYMN